MFIFQMNLVAATVAYFTPVNRSTNQPGVVQLSYGANPSYSNRVFNVYLGQQPTLGPSNIVATTAASFWTLKDLAPQQTYFWKIEAVDGTNSSFGTNRQFTTAPLGPVHHFEWELTGAHYTNRSSTAWLKAKDVNRHTISNFNDSVRLTATGNGVTTPRIVISEVSPYWNEVEFANVTSSNLNLAGWKITIYDKASWPAPLHTLTLPPNSTVPVGGLFSLSSGTIANGLYPSFYLGTNINWGTLTNDPAAVLIQDENGLTVDFMALGGARVEEIVTPFMIPASEWSTSPVARNAQTIYSYHRIGFSDSNDTTDWTSGFSNIRIRYPGMSTVFLNGRGALSLDQTTITNFVDGTALVQFRIGTTNNDVRLIADDTAGHRGVSERFAVNSAPPLALTLPNSVREGDVFSSTGRVVLPEIPLDDVVVTFEASDATELVLPEQVVIPAGTAEGLFTFTANDDGILDGTQIVTIIARAASFIDATNSIASHDRQTALLSLQVPTSLNETGGVAQATVTVSSPSAKSFEVIFSTQPTNQLQFPARVRIDLNTTSASFDISARADSILEGDHVVELIAFVDGWEPGVAQINIVDRERAELQLTLPATFDESDGTRTGVGRVNAGGILQTNLVVELSSSDPANLTVPTTATILAGQSNVVFNVVITDDVIPESPSLPVTVSATAAGFVSSQKTTAILDNDPAEIRFANIPSPQFTDRSMEVILTAYGVDGNVLTNFKGNLQLEAFNAQGAVNLATNVVRPFAGGVCFAQVRVTAPASLVRLRPTVYAGESNPFHVEWPDFRTMSFSASDLVYDASSRTLFATTPSANTEYSNMIVAIDPITLSVTNAYPLTIEPGRMEMAPNGGFAYILSSDQRTFERFNFNTRTTSTKFTVSTNTIVTEFTVVGGAQDSVVARLSDSAANSGGIWRYNAGAPAKIASLSDLDPYHLDSDATGTLYGFQNNNLYPLMRLGGSLQTANQVLQGGALWHRDGVLYDNLGYAASASSLQPLGFYAATGNALEKAFVDVDPVMKRTFFLSGRWGSSTVNPRLVVFDTASFNQVTQIPISNLSSAPLRFLHLEANRLVFNTASGQIWFIESSQLQPQTATDLLVSQQLISGATTLDQPAQITLTITNSGPHVASLLRLTNTIPLGAKFVSSSTDAAGAVTKTTYGFDWNIWELPAGQSASLTFTIAFGNGGQQTNSASVINYEGDPNFFNNLSTLPLYVTLPEASLGGFLVNYPSHDLLYDPAQDKLLVMVQGQPGALPNGIALLNPHNGAQTAFNNLSQKPLLMERTAGSEYLYVSYKDATRVGRLQLPSFTQDLSFTLGRETNSGNIYSLYAAGLTPVPNDPRSIVVWQVRAPHPMAGEFGIGMAMFTDGVMMTNNIPIGDGMFYSFAWNSTGQKVYTYSYGDTYVRDLKSYEVSSTGLKFLESYPRLSGKLGLYMHSANDRLINDAGREISLDPFGVTGVFGGAESAATAVVDTNAARVFFLTSTGSQKWQINAYHLNDREPVGTIPLPSFVGTAPTDLILWGSNGLAFRASTNQLMIIRTDLRQLELEADLQITALDTGSNTVTLKVINHGPGSAAGVSVAHHFSAATTIESFVATTGIFDPTNGLWEIGPLAVGASAELTLTLPATATALTVKGALSTTTADPIAHNNTATVVVSPATGGLNNLPLVATDLVWSPANNRLLAIVKTGQGHWSDTLISIDPNSSAIRSELYAGAGATKLTLNDKDSRLFIGINNAVRDFSLPGLTPLDVYPLDPTGAPWSVADLRVLPGTTNSLAVRRLYNSASDLAVLDAGLLRTNTAPVAVEGTLELDTQGGQLFYNPFNYSGFSRYQISTNGVTLTDTDTELLPLRTLMDMAPAEGVLITSDGTHFNPRTRAKLGQFKNVPITSKVVYDPGSRRVFFAFKEGTNLVCRAFDTTTRMLLGEQLIPTTLADPANLIRWGENGLAYHATNGIGIFRTPLLPQGAPADLQLQLVPLGEQVAFGEEFSYAFTITNAGPNTALNARLLLKLSAHAGPITVEIGTTTNTTSQGEAIVSLGSLEAGGTAHVTVRTTPVSSGALVCVGNVISDTPDAALANNTRSRETPVLRFIARGEGFLLPESVSDVVYDSTRLRLYLSTLDSKILVVNPVSTTMEAKWSLSAVPKLLALSDDDSQLYAGAGAGDGQTIIRINPATGIQNLRFALASIEIQDIQPVPGKPRSVIISQRHDFNNYSIKLYNNNQERPKSLHTTGSGASIEFGSSPQVAYVLGDSSGANFRTLRIDTDGIEDTAWATLPGQNNVGTIHFANDRIYGDSGLVVDPQSYVVTDVVGGLGQGSKVAVDPAKARLIYLARSGTNWESRVYDIHTLALIGKSPLPASKGAPARLVRWESDGLAYTTTSNELVLARSPFLPGEPAASVALSLVASTELVTLGNRVAITATVTNQGPNDLSGAFLSLRLPASALYRGALSTNGITVSTNLITCAVGQITNGGTASFTFYLEPTRVGTLEVSASVASPALEEDLADNHAKISTAVQFGLADDQSAFVDLASSYFIHDSHSGLIYVLGSDRSQATRGKIFALDPRFGTYRTVAELPPGLKQAVISEDGSKLHVIGGNGTHIHTVQLPHGSLDPDINVGALDRLVEEIHIVPGKPDSLAVILYGSKPALFRNGVLQPLTGFLGNHLVVYSPDDAIIWKPNMVPSVTYRAQILTNGIQQISGGLSYFMDGNMTLADSLIYTTGGSVIDPVSLTKLRKFDASGLIAPMPELNRVAFLTLTNLSMFEDLTTNFISTIPVPLLGAVPRQLIHAGGDRLALRTDSSIVIFRTRTIPNSPLDSDGDGLPDDWELPHGLDMLDSSDATADTDSDGLDNRSEYRAGTNPYDGASTLYLQTTVSSGTLAFTFDRVSGRTYHLQSSQSVAGPWITVREIIADDHTSFTLQAETGTNIGPSFYRVIIP